MIESIEVKGKLVHECCVAGETRAEDVFPAHANGIPLSHDRWLIIYATRGWRKVDDDRSIIYQIRKDAPDGDLLKEGMLRQATDDWDPDGDGSRLLSEYGHCGAFGVPKGAKFEGHPMAHENVFVARWRVNAKGRLDPLTGAITAPADEAARHMGVEWVQFRLNDAGDDIDILQPVQPLHERGFESERQICARADADHMNQSYAQAVPYNPMATEWVDVNHFSGGRIAALRYRFNPRIRIYEWVETSPFLPSAGLGEASIARLDEGWLIAARGEGMTAWVRTDDPFRRMPPVTYTTRPVIQQPLTLYRCADGTPRLFTGDCATSPYGHGRNPLYCWEIDPLSFEARNGRMLFDCVASGTLPNSTIPRAEMCKLLPHMGGRSQYLVWRVRTKNVGHPYGTLCPVTPEMKDAHGLYYAVITYDRDVPGAWQF